MILTLSGLNKFGAQFVSAWMSKAKLYQMFAQAGKIADKKSSIVPKRQWHRSGSIRLRRSSPPCVTEKQWLLTRWVTTSDKHTTVTLDAGATTLKLNMILSLYVRRRCGVLFKIIRRRDACSIVKLFSTRVIATILWCKSTIGLIVANVTLQIPQTQ